MRKNMLWGLSLAALAITGVARAQNTGDVYRHMADCQDAYKASQDDSAFLRCMADVQDEIDNLSSDDASGEQNTGDIYRHMADCQDAYKASQDDSAFLRCMADVQDEIDGMDSHSASGENPGAAARARAQYQFQICEHDARSQSDRDNCLADFHTKVGPNVEPSAGGPDISDEGTPHGDLTKCIYLAQTPAEIKACGDKYETATSPTAPVSPSLEGGSTPTPGQNAQNIHTVVVQTTAPSPAASQPPAHPITADQVHEMLQLSGAARLRRQIFDTMMPMVRQSMPPYMPPDVMDDFENSFLGADFEAALLHTYQAHLSTDDGAQIIAFYKTPAGQHLLLAMPQIARDSQIAGEQLAQQVMMEVLQRHQTEIDAAKLKYESQHPWSAPKN
jgi:hypothetical protein